MDHVLVAIKRLCQADRIVLTAKAEVEMDRDGLTRRDVVESISMRTGSSAGFAPEVR